MATWTIAALSPEIRQVSGRCWRVVEAQHVVSTMALVDTLDEQALLEQVLDASKPAVPDDCRQHHYLLFTRFRYAAWHPHGSRFRGAGLTPGVFYASLELTTAIAEMAFWRLLFYAESPATPWPANAGEYTAFTVRFAARKGLDLTRPPLNQDAVQWTEPVDYAHCQALAETARSAGVQAIRYQSARAPGVNVALFACAAFAALAPDDQRRWRIHVSAAGARAISESPDERLAFERAAFARDPRIASMKWDRSG